MKRILPIILFVFCSVVARAQGQNLVINPSFENYNNCPTMYSYIPFIGTNVGIAYSAIYSLFPTLQNWVSPTDATPDYYNTCAPANIFVTAMFVGTIPASVHVPDNLQGYQYAHTGNAYAGFFAGSFGAIGATDGYRMYQTTDTDFARGTAYGMYSEYLETKLSKPLHAGHHYNAHFYTNYASYFAPIDTSMGNTCAIDQIGAYFSTKQVNQYAANYLTFKPQVVSKPGLIITDTVNWLKVDGNFVATGDEQWLTLGRFYDSTSFSSKLLHILDTSWNPFANPPELGLTENSQNAYYYIDDICVLDLDSPIVSRTDTTLCSQDLPITYTGPDSMQRYQWNTGAATRSLTIKDTGTYWVRSLGECSIYVDTFHIRYFQSPLLALGNDTNYCPGGTGVISTNHIYPAYHWNTGDTTGSITVSQAGWYALTITDTCGHFQTDSIQITFNPTPKPLAAADTTICQDVANPILNVIGASLKWYSTTDGTGTNQQPEINTTTPDVSTTLYVTQTNPCGESDKAAIKVMIEGKPHVTLSPDSTFCEGKTVTIKATADRLASYLWSTGQAGNTLVVNTPGTYIVQATSSCGIDADTVTLRAQDCDKSCLFIPSAFSPNADGKNDVFHVLSTCNVLTCHMVILDRWGKKVFEASGIDHGWDGTINGAPADIGTYFYQVESTPELSGGKSFVEKGDITLVR